MVSSNWGRHFLSDVGCLRFRASVFLRAKISTKASLGAGKADESPSETQEFMPCSGGPVVRLTCFACQQGLRSFHSELILGLVLWAALPGKTLNATHLLLRWWTLSGNSDRTRPRAYCPIPLSRRREYFVELLTRAVTSLPVFPKLLFLGVPLF